jgi:hypothetical protein
MNKEKYKNLFGEFYNINFKFIPSFIARIILFLLDMVSIYNFSLLRGILINFVIVSSRNKNMQKMWGGQCGKFSKIAGGIQISNFGSLIIGDYYWVSINSRFIMREGTYIIT